MILEVAQFRLKPGSGPGFEAGVTKAVDLFRRAKGFRGLRLLKTIEDPDAYQLHVVWETLENHTVHFRESEDFREWRRLVGGFFAEPPKAVHCMETVAASPKPWSDHT
ncbi:heme-degrading monooxygenase HmoA [Paraburkholderia sp. BL6665CI2N2]|uniref:antibiotic biosynthesis monooxygenase family protein n=1 Tax=Paraburkholderia sp. BL6665CI2N2 TaxID=1938806 RepID=UPI001064B6D9|nr:antibiotic biosynthesis monooxygenase [Paraburkholderia sp. BL6665CI2N2]TDY22035.1 heme-degrading monooxygenase HmoA [Paraburkholderia sp. BL6665CI2N2]